MLENWNTYKLGELARFINGRAYANDEFRNSGTPIVRIQNLTGQGNFVYSDLDLPLDKLIEKGDLIYAWSATFGPYIWKGSKSIYHYHIWKIICKEGLLDKHFFYYKLKHISDSIKGRGTGSIFTHITKTLIENFESKFPDYSEQRRIAEILSALDERIELNLEMNRTLERIAQATFKYWFVDFQFPGFDGELVDGLPEGWRKGKVRDVCTVNTNTLSKKDDLEVIKYIEISEVSKGIVNNVSVYKKGEEPSRAKRKLLHGDIVISTVRPDRSSYFLAFYPEKDLVASTGFAVFTATFVPFSFLYIFLTDVEQMTYYGRVADGGAYPAINQSVIMNIDLIIPSNEILEQFHSFAEPLFERIGYNLNEIKTLTQIRDGLLPKLMSGKIRVKSE